MISESGATMCVHCTDEERKVVNAFRRFCNLWRKHGGDLFMVVTPDAFHIEKRSLVEGDRLVNEEAVIHSEYGIPYDMGDF